MLLTAKGKADASTTAKVKTDAYYGKSHSQLRQKPMLLTTLKVETDAFIIAKVETDAFSHQM